MFDEVQNRPPCFVDKAKGRISKRVFQENKARQIFRKTNISYPLICTHPFSGLLIMHFIFCKGNRKAHLLFTFFKIPSILNFNEFTWNFLGIPKMFLHSLVIKLCTIWLQIKMLCITQQKKYGHFIYIQN